MNGSPLVGLRFAVGLLLVAAADDAWGQAAYTVTDLGTLSGGTLSAAYGINDNGQVVGFAGTSGGAQHAFFYCGGMHDLGTLIIGSSSLATAINTSGQIVGYGDEDRGPLVFTHAFLASGGTMQDLGTLGGNTSHAYGVNSSGEVVGDSLTSSGVDHAFSV